MSSVQTTASFQSQSINLVIVLFVILAVRDRPLNPQHRLFRKPLNLSTSTNSLHVEQKLSILNHNPTRPPLNAEKTFACFLIVPAVVKKFPVSN